MADIYSERMEKIIAMVPAGRRVCDVGCDHGYISIALVERGICTSALAMDINEGPLKAATDNVSAKALQDQITLKLSDGLNGYIKGSSDSLIIAGMGGPLICDILEEGSEVLSDFKELILSPQSKISDVRIYLSNKGYEIVDEDMLIEDGKYYVIIKASKTGNELKLDETDYLLGPKLLEKRHKVLSEYIKKSMTKDEEILTMLFSKNQSQKNTERIKEIQKEIKLLKIGDERVGS